MIAWISSFAFLAVALAAPQLQTLSVQPLRSQIISSQPSAQYISSQVPLNLVGNVQNLPYTNVQSLPIQNIHTVGVQGLPVNTYQQLPVQTLRVSQLPVQQTVQYRQPIYKTAVAQPIIKSVAQPIYKTATVQPLIQSQHIVQAQPIVHAPVAPLAYQQRITPQIQGAAILRQVQDHSADGTYTFAYETENGIRAQEDGHVVNAGTDAETNVVSGSYSYTSPDGTPITVNYVADENGFRAEGEHIPKPSEAILRSLEYLRSLPPRPEDESGKYVPDRNRY